jgi:hypothetical protein
VSLETHWHERAGKEGVEMNRSAVFIVMVALVGIGSYAVFAQYQQLPQQYQQAQQQAQPQPPMGGPGMGGGMGPGMGRGMMQGGMGRGMMQGGMGRGMMGGMGRGMMQGGMGRGMMMGPGPGPMAGPGCPGCGAICGALAQESVTPTSDGGVVVAVAGKLIKYDGALKRVAEADLDVDWTQVHRRIQQIMQNCPMTQGYQSTPSPPPTEVQATHEQHHPSQP